MSVKEITIGSDYAAIPGGRYVRYGDFSGEHFRDAVLVPALNEFDRVLVFLDGTKTYMSSFLEEAFGGLIRERGFTYDDLQKRLTVGAREPKYSIYVKMVGQDLLDAATESSKTPARVA